MQMTAVTREFLRGCATFGPSFLVSFFRSRVEGRIRVVNRVWGKLYLRDGQSDLSVYRAIFVKMELNIQKFPQYSRIKRRCDEIVARGRVPIILDLGANIGVSSVWFALMFPQAKILAVEPDPDNVVLCRLNAGQFTNIKVVAAAIGARRGKVDLATPNELAWAIQTRRSDSGSVSVVTVDDLLSDEGPDADIFLVKVDIEGFERDLFQDNLEWIDSAAAIIVEPHDWLFPDEETSQPLQRALVARGREILICGEHLLFV
jgi:FkbM family methyltransferase